MAITHKVKVGGVAVGDVSDYVMKCREVIDHEVVRTLSRLGEEGVAFARDRSQEDSFNNITGNLRSSIGYAVYKDRKQVTKSGFKAIPAPSGDGSLGKQYGEMALVRAAKDISPTDTALVLVAGMSYAQYVEAMDNKDVLASTELYVKAKFPSYLAKTKQRIKALLSKL